MIRINCTNCKAQLSIDEAFAGGVCRCQYCGTIQTVPKHLKTGDGGSSGVVAQAAGRAPKTLYKNKARADGGGGSHSSGLDAIADRVAGGISSGLVAGLEGRSPVAPPTPPTAPAPAGNNMVPLILGVAGVIVVLLGIVIWLLIKSNNPVAASTDAPANNPPSVKPANGSVTPAANDAVNNAIAAAKLGPNFLGVKLTEPVVVFVIDRGNATNATFDYVKIACLKSLNTMRSDQKFLVIFWKLDKEKSPIVAPPGNAPVPVTHDWIQKAETAMDNVTAFGQTDVKAAIDKAFSVNPGAIVLATGKSSLDDNFVKMVLAARKNSAAKIHCFALNEQSSAKAMLDIASKTAGIARMVPMEELHALSR